MEFAQSPLIGRYRGVFKGVFNVVEDKGASVYGAGLGGGVDRSYFSKDF